MKRIMVIFAMLAVLVLPIKVLAVNTNTQQPELPTVTSLKNTDNSNKPTVESLTEARKDAIKSKCSSLQGKMEQIADRVQNLSQQRTNLFDNITRVLNNFVLRLENNNIDASELKTDVDELGAMVAEAKTAWESYQTALQNTVNGKCNEDPSAYHNSLEASKLALGEVKTNMSQIKAFIKSEIKGDLDRIREQLKTRTQNEDSTTID